MRPESVSSRRSPYSVRSKGSIFRASTGLSSEGNPRHVTAESVRTGYATYVTAATTRESLSFSSSGAAFDLRPAAGSSTAVPATRCLPSRILVIARALPDLVQNVTEGHTLVPTFAFIDPFGYSAASMSLTGRFLGFRRTEALFFLPLSFIHRFVGREGQESALTALFDSEDWREAIALKGEERSTFLLELFERQLQSQGRVEHVRSFQVRTSDGNDYRLVFATGHDRGLDIIKQAMWSVDPVAGTRYVAKTESGQEVLFQSSVDTRPLVNA